MFNISKKLGLFALVCALVGLAGCGGGSGTGSKKAALKVCENYQALLADGTCGTPPPLPPCDDGYIRDGNNVCVKSDFKVPTQPDLSSFDADTRSKLAVIYLNSTDKKFNGYSLHLWNNGPCGVGWDSPTIPDAAGTPYTVPTTWPNGPGIKSTGEGGAFPEDPIYGAYFILKAADLATCGNFIVKSAGAASQTKDLSIPLKTTGSPFDRRYFIIMNGTNLQNADTNSLPICLNGVCEAYAAPALAISGVSAHWIDHSTILWDRDVTEVKLYKAEAGKKMSANADGTVANGVAIADLTATTITGDQSALVPHLSALNAYSIDLDTDVIKDALKQELLIVGKEADGHLFGTHIQNAYLLDELYTSGADDADEQHLGVAYDGDAVSVSVWAPTATNVELRIFGDTPKIAGDAIPVIATKSMTLNNDTGIWSYTGTKAELDRKFYRFRVTGYNAVANQVEVLEVVDPSAVSLSTNGYHSQFVNLDDADLKPAGWDSQVIAPIASPEEISIYEVHVRDFSILDESTPAAHRGKYLAFTDTDSAPVTHLKELAAAGMTHIHLLPINDGTSIKEDFTQQINLDSMVFQLCVATNNTAPICAKDVRPNNLLTLRQVLKGYAGNTDSARLLMNSFKDLDGFNWNYDPQFYNAPEGSYSTNPNGVTRITEVRAMNQSLHNLGLHVVMDVVYPHMKDSGVASGNSTFDKIVPGYYFRSNIVTGAVEGGSGNGTGAGSDTATEHVMMAKFVKDSLFQWADKYKVDGFRFDQSGYMPKAVLVDAYNAVKAINPDAYFYAEAWSPSSGSASARIGAANLATQASLAGTGIGTFNDRIRDQLNRLNIVNGGNLDKVRAGLAGNLTEFKILVKSGALVKAGDNSIGAYNLDPQEDINYVEKHDGLTLWDWMHLPNALPANTSLENRVRIQDLTLSIPLLSQGVSFVQMGADLLRSKSMDNNSYNSGDWFNYVDFTKQTNNWMVGLPVEHSATDDEITAAFADPLSKPTPELIQASSDAFNTFLAISKGKLFNLQTAEEVIDRVGFHDGGTTQVDNVIVMSIDDGAGMVKGTSTPRPDLDPDVDAIVVIFNGTNGPVTRKISTATGFTLHPLLQSSTDTIVQTASFADGTGADAGKGLFTVPAYTTAVFVKAENGTQGAGLTANVTSEAVPPIPYGTTQIYLPGTLVTPNWDFTGNELVYQSNGIYTATLHIDASATPYQFKIASSDWSTVDRGTLKTAPAVVLNTPKAFAPGGSDVDNATILISTTADYLFTLDATDPSNPVLTVTDAQDIYHGTPVYLKGTATSWDAKPEYVMTYAGNGLYTITLPTLAAGSYQFKIANADWTVPNLGTSTAVTLGAPLDVMQGSNDNIPLTISTTGSYTFTLDVTTPTAPKVTVQ